MSLSAHLKRVHGAVKRPAAAAPPGYSGVDAVRVTEQGAGVSDEHIKSLSVTCQCGKVEFEVIGAPILAASCHCTSCRRAGRAFEALPSAPPVLDADGGSPVLLYRKDRVRCVAGLQYLEEHRLKPDSPSRRVLAACCNSAMFGDFTKGHWLSLYRKRFPPARRRWKCGS